MTDNITLEWIENKLKSEKTGEETKRESIILGSIATAIDRVKQTLINCFVIQTILKDNDYVYNYRKHEKDIISNFNQVFDKIKMNHDIKEKKDRTKLEGYPAIMQILNLSEANYTHLHYYRDVLVMIDTMVSSDRLSTVISDLNGLILDLTDTSINMTAMLSTQMLKLDDEQIESKKQVLLPDNVKNNQNLILP